MANEKMLEALKGKPQPEPKEISAPDGTVKRNFFDLIIRDIETDLTIIKTMKDNAVALRGWLGSIGNAKTRDAFKSDLEDRYAVLNTQSIQKKLLLEHFTKMRVRWLDMEQKLAAVPAKDGEPSAPEASMSEPAPSFAPAAAAPETSPAA